MHEVKESENIQRFAETSFHPQITQILADSSIHGTNLRESA